ncbi:MAG: RsmE family RNA methyltransferase [Dehalococcoidia bacterium]|nr:RsmE family RNA methyltransferase [Dehalococcoidia bacterium]
MDAVPVLRSPFDRLRVSGKGRLVDARMADTPLRRFFVPPDSIRARNVTLGPELSHRLGRVLRLRRGDRVVLAGGGRHEYVVQLTGVSPHAVTGIVVEERAPPPEPQVELTLYQSLIRPQRFDLVLEKGTEIGVSRFVPVITARAQNQAEEPSAARAERWARIVTEAAEQCDRGKLPRVEAPAAFAEAVRQSSGLRLLPYEGESGGRGLGAYLRGLPERPRAVSLFIGPEGGFEPSEVELARREGLALVTLGRRILRSETAGIVAAALVLDALGEMGA